MLVRKTLPFWLLIFLPTALLFGSLLNVPYIDWDDGMNIFSNPHYQAGEWLVFWKESYFGVYIPFTNSVWQVLYVLGHGSSWPYRAMNLTLHLANVVLVFLLLQALAKRWGIKSKLALLFGVAVFAFHPLQVHGVAWISAGRDLLAAFLALSATALYLRKPGARSYVFSTILYGLALLSKPGVVVLPMAMVALNGLFHMEDWRMHFKKMSLWAAMAAAITVVTHNIQSGYLEPIEFWRRPVLMADTLLFHLQKTVWPFGLSGNHGRIFPIVFGSEWLWPRVFIFYGLAALIAYWGLKKDRRFQFAALWLILFLPVSGLFSFGYQKISTVSEHYNYVPMIVIGALAMLLLEKSAKPLRWIAPLIAIGFFVLSQERVDVWRSDESFFSQMAEISPDSYSTDIGMSVVSCLKRSDYMEGVKWTERALAAQPGDVLGLSNRAYCLFHAHRFDLVVAMLPDFKKMDLKKMEVEQPTTYTSFLDTMGSAYANLGRLTEGLWFICEAARIRPTDPGHQQNLRAITKVLQDRGVSADCNRTQIPSD
jgi:hypothetical protein